MQIIPVLAANYALESHMDHIVAARHILYVVILR